MLLAPKNILTLSLFQFLPVNGWYNDAVQQHTFVLRLFLFVRSERLVELQKRVFSWN